jgi:TRAP-type mannitol/chloroaromatic compound transport system substrate-binding protein
MWFMKRRQFFKGAAIAAGASTFAAPAIAQTEPVIRWRCVSSFPKNIEVLYGNAEVLAKNVAEATDGKFQIQVFAAGEVVPALQALDAASNDTVEMCHTASYYYVGKDPSFAFGACLPFGLNTRQQNAWFYHGEGGKLLEEFYAGYNLKALAGGNTGAQMGGWFRKEIKSVEDLKGLKFRISGLGGQILSRLGVVPQQVGGGDIYPALERGTIDAAEFNGPYDDEKLGLYKIAPYYYYPGWWDGTSMQHFFINTKHWDSLPKHYQAALTSAAALANVDSLARYDVLNPPALRRVVENGAKPRAFPPDVLQASYQAATELYDELSGSNPTFKKFYESYRKFQSESNLWLQASEYSYDSAMLRMTRG